MEKQPTTSQHDELLLTSTYPPSSLIPAFFPPQVRHGSVQPARVPRGQLVCYFPSTARFLCRHLRVFALTGRVSFINQITDLVACEETFIGADTFFWASEVRELAGVDA